jgi:hypothetical protein
LALSWLIARTAEWKTIVTPTSVVIAFSVSVAVGGGVWDLPGGEGVTHRSD